MTKGYASKLTENVDKYPFVKDSLKSTQTEGFNLKKHNAEHHEDQL